MLIVFAVVLANAQFAAAVALKVMPLGDSITAGCTADTGPWGGAYRTRLWQDFGSSAANLDFLGSVQSDPNNPPELGDRDNEGHSGYTIQYVPGRGNLYDNIPTWLNSSVNPDVILMMIGTNDIFGDYAVANAPTRLSQLISRITTQKPSARLIVASITPALNPTINGRVTTFNAAIPSIVDTHKLNGEQVYYVDMYSAMTTPATDILPDGAHPSPSGYVKMGDAWYGAIQSLQDPCSDSLDNDGDGLVDYPADPGCVDASDLSERDPFLFCDDGADNDGDGRTDFDPFTFANPGDQYTPPSGSGDPGCGAPTWSTESPPCQDGLHNDGDGMMDYDAGYFANGSPDPSGPDPQCIAPWWNSEAPWPIYCGMGVELALLLPPLMWLWRRRRQSVR